MGLTPFCNLLIELEKRQQAFLIAVDNIDLLGAGQNRLIGLQIETLLGDFFRVYVFFENGGENLATSPLCAVHPLEGESPGPVDRSFRLSFGLWNLSIIGFLGPR